jgi:spore maturation protein CgeB
MKLVVFGLSLSSSWGNGHATLWRGLLGALGRRGHASVFFERDVPYYAAHRDAAELPGTRLILYRSWDEIVSSAERELADAEVAIITSYCADGPVASELVLRSRVAQRVFYDLDTPITLERAARGERIEYLPTSALSGFDLVLTYTGGRALDELRTRLGAVRVAPLYGSVDPAVHRPAPATERYRAALSYLGTYAADRQAGVEALLVEVARRRPCARFVVAGAQYPAALVWPPNVARIEHLSPGEHASFYGSSPLTLSVTRAAMARLGYCPSGRLFEAAACGVPVLSDGWPGLERFFTPGEEILVARNTGEALAALALSPEALARIGRAARDRALAEHTAERRASELLSILQANRGGHDDGHHSRGRDGQPNPAAGVLQGAAPRR